MKFKLITEDKQGDPDGKGKGQSLEFEVKPDVEMVCHFLGFAVVMNHEGCTLVLPKGIRETIFNMGPEHDRVILMEPELQGDPEAFDRLRNVSLDWYPKDEVELVKLDPTPDGEDSD